MPLRIVFINGNVVQVGNGSKKTLLKGESLEFISHNGFNIKTRELHHYTSGYEIKRKKYQKFIVF